MGFDIVFLSLAILLFRRTQHQVGEFRVGNLKLNGLVRSRVQQPSFAQPRSTQRDLDCRFSVSHPILGAADRSQNGMHRGRLRR